MPPGPQTREGTSLPGHGQSLTERSGTLILFILGSVLAWPGSAVYKQALCWLEVGGRGGGSQLGAGGKLDTRLELFMMWWLPVRYRMGV